MSTPWDGSDAGPPDIVLANRHRRRANVLAPNSPARRLKRWVIAALSVLAVVLVALSPSFGRAEPTGQYRPPLPPDALTNGCYPLPDGVRFDFSYQVRSDGDVGNRRNLVIQYNLVDRDEALAAVTAAFTDAGFTPGSVAVGYPGDRDDVRTFALARGDDTVTGLVIPMVPLTEDQLVRGTIELSLPVVERRSDDPVCSDVESTKRFAEADR